MVDLQARGRFLTLERGAAGFGTFYGTVELNPWGRVRERTGINGSPGMGKGLRRGRLGRTLYPAGCPLVTYRQ